MPFNPGVKKSIVIDQITGKHRPCVMCGKTYPLPAAVHIIDQHEWKKVSEKGHDSKHNGIPLCPNCHRVFDEVLKPFLYRALTKYGCQNLPKGWSKSNKFRIREISERDLGLED